MKRSKGQGELSAGNPHIDARIDSAKSQIQALADMIALDQQPLHSVEPMVLEICNIGYPESLGQVMSSRSQLSS